MRSRVIAAVTVRRSVPDRRRALGGHSREEHLLVSEVKHLDQAKQLGAEVPYLFNDLGEQYEAEGRHADAARAYLKAVGNGPDRIGALMRFFQNAGDSIREGW